MLIMETIVSCLTIFKQTKELILKMAHCALCEKMWELNANRATLIT